MAWRKIEDSKLKAIANAIREMTGKSWNMTVNAMPTLIKTIGDLDINNPHAKSIGDCVFYECTPLKSASFPNVTSVGTRAFVYCRKLTTINFPRLQTIGNSAFDSCSSLDGVELPEVKSIGSYAFAYTSNLKTLILSGATVPTLVNTDAFINSAIAKGTGYIYVPDNLVSAYKRATNWATYANQIKPISELEV